MPLPLNAGPMDCQYLQSFQKPSPPTIPDRSGHHDKLEVEGTVSKITEDDLQEHLLAVFGSPETVLAWLRSPNSVLASETPDNYLRRGDTVAVQCLLLMAETGMPT